MANMHGDPFCHKQTRSARIFMEKIPTGKSQITGTAEANEIWGR